MNGVLRGVFRCWWGGKEVTGLHACLFGTGTMACACYAVSCGVRHLLVRHEDGCVLGRKHAGHMRAGQARRSGAIPIIARILPHNCNHLLALAACP